MSPANNPAPVARVRHRRKLFQPADLEFAGGRCRAHIIDLSESGAQLNAGTPPTSGGFVTLICGDVRRSARVAWVRGSRCGIAFVLPLASEQVDAILSLGAAIRRAG